VPHAKERLMDLPEHDENCVDIGEDVLGDPLTVDLASKQASLDGVAKLATEQVAALNGGRLCWGLRLRGTDVAATADGWIRATYEVRTLTVRAGVAVF
jgi:hypothetical protein